jgi:hypothetical protein
MADIDFNNMTLPEAEALAGQLESERQLVQKSKVLTPVEILYIAGLYVVDIAWAISAVSENGLKGAIAPALLGLAFGGLMALRVRIPHGQMQSLDEKQEILQTEVLPAMRLRQALTIEQSRPTNPSLN